MISTIDRVRPLQHFNNVLMYLERFFSNLDFNEEAHQYKYKGREFSSVSKYIKQYTKPFDAERIAGFVAKKRGVTKADILQEWEDTKNEACEKGNRVHQFGEYYHSHKLNPSDGYEEAIVNFWNDVPDHVILVRNEIQMFSEELGVAGTADILLFNTKTGRFIIADYKTNKDLFKNHRGQTLLDDYKFLKDMPYSKYEIQLSFYQLLFEQTGFEVENRIIVWLKPDGSYEKYFTRDLRENIQQTFKDED